MSQSAVIGVIAEKQRADRRMVPGRVCPTDDDEFLAVETFRLHPQAAIARRVRAVDPLRDSALTRQPTRVLAKGGAISDHVLAEAKLRHVGRKQCLQPFLALDERQARRVFVLVDQILLAQRNADDALHHQRLRGMLDQVGVPGVGEDRFFHGYYACYCYLRPYVFCGRHLLVAKLRRSNIDASAGAVEEAARIVRHIRARWPRVRIMLRADNGFAREALRAWCEQTVLISCSTWPAMSV